MSEDYQPKPGDKVLLTVRAEVDEDLDYRLVAGRDGRKSFLVPGAPSIVRVEPAPIPVPAELGAVILAEVSDQSRPARLMLCSGGPYPEDSGRWVHVDRPGDTYSPSEITRVHEVPLAGEPS